MIELGGEETQTNQVSLILIITGLNTLFFGFLFVFVKTMKKIKCECKSENPESNIILNENEDETVEEEPDIDNVEVEDDEDDDDGGFQDPREVLTRIMKNKILSCHDNPKPVIKFYEEFCGEEILV